MEESDRKNYIKSRKRLSGIFFETALPNEYLVVVGTKKIKPVLGGKRFRLFKKILRVPGSVETLYFKTDNANMNYQGIGVEGYASWRIDPERPATAIATLDFFNDDDPMRDTNNKLTTICIEAVRHVIANMTIDDALKKKDEIGNNLKNQLKKFEDRWGILFDQVGIEKVRIMSESLFEDLQSEYRDKLRLDVSTNRIHTDRKIAGEENAMHEVIETEKLSTKKKLLLTQAEGESEVNKDSLEKSQMIFEQERIINEDRFRKETEFKQEQQKLEYENRIKEKELKSELQKMTKVVLESEEALEKIRNEIARRKLEIAQQEKIVDQTFTQEQLSYEFIKALPSLYEALDIDNFSIMETSSNGGISPVGQILQEVIGLVKANGLEHLLNKSGKGSEK